MQIPSPRLAAITIGAAFGVSLCPELCAQGAEFAPPVRLTAGDALLGTTRLYPSPAVHDFDGDGRFDVFIGDLRGLVTYALQRPDGEQIRFDTEQKLKDAEGKVLDFGNW